MGAAGWALPEGGAGAREAPRDRQVIHARRGAYQAIGLGKPCPASASAPASSDLEEVRDAVFCLINRERARNGESPLRASARLRLAAQEHSDEMVAQDYFAHEGPGGETLLDRVRACGYLHGSRVGYVLGENIAWGTRNLATPQAIVGAWMASPEHRANILNASFRDTGIGVAPGVPSVKGDGQPGGTYTQDFGVILRPDGRSARRQR
jgi:uncharacterized protein YkwD